MRQTGAAVERGSLMAAGPSHQRHGREGDARHDLGERRRVAERSQREGQGPRADCPSEPGARFQGWPPRPHQRARSSSRRPCGRTAKPGVQGTVTTPGGAEGHGVDPRGDMHDKAFPAFQVVEPGKRLEVVVVVVRVFAPDPFTLSITPSSSLSSSSSLRCDTRNLATKTCCWTW